MNDADEQHDFGNEDRQIRNVAFLAFLLNLGLAGVKGWLAYESASLAVTAGAVDSAADSVASLAVFFGLLLSARKTKTFPLGLYKVENLISVIVALFIFFAGYEIATRLIRPPAPPPDITLSLLWWMLGCTVAVFLFGKYALFLGEKTESPALKAEGRHRQADALASLVVLISVLLNYYHIDFQYSYFTIDRIAALFVLAFIIKAGWELLTDGMRVLLDASADRATLDKAREIIQKEPAVKVIRSLAGRNAGRFRFLNADIALRTDDLKKAHRISERIETAVRQEIPHVERVMIHYAPDRTDVQRIAFPTGEDGETIYPHFGEAPNFAIWQIRPREGEVEKKTILKNPFSRAEKGKGIQAARFLTEQNIDKAGARKKIEFSGPGYVFSDAGVQTFEVSEDTVEAAVRGHMTSADKEAGPRDQ